MKAMLVSCGGYWGKAPGGKLLLLWLILHRSYTSTSFSSFTAAHHQADGTGPIGSLLGSEHCYLRLLHKGSQEKRCTSQTLGGSASSAYQVLYQMISSIPPVIGCPKTVRLCEQERCHRQCFWRRRGILQRVLLPKQGVYWLQLGYAGSSSALEDGACDMITSSSAMVFCCSTLSLCRANPRKWGGPPSW